MKKDKLDIEHWKPSAGKLSEFAKKESNQKEKTYTYDLRKYKINHIKLYCLFKSKVHDKPFGILTQLQNDQPISNLFWWDFIIESDLGFIHVYRKQSFIEIMTNVNPEKFSIQKFIEFNFKKYSKEIDESLKNLEEHKLYVNHFHSYLKICSFLSRELKNIDLSFENREEEIEGFDGDYSNQMNQYIDNNIKFHANGKSLLLNSAFLVEAYINMIIRISARNHFKEFSGVLNKFLKSDFRNKVKNLRFYTIVLKENLNMNDKAVENVFELMRLRNKYVHSDLSSNLNEVGNVYFDNDFPVFSHYKHSPIVENLRKIYQNPTRDKINSCYSSAIKFITYVESKFVKHEYVDQIKMVMNQNPIGYNLNSLNYSAIFSTQLVDFRFGGISNDEEE